MGLLPYKRLAHDQDGTDLQEFSLPYPPLKVDYSENNNVSSLITLNDNTTSLEIHVSGGSVGLTAGYKWISASTIAGLGNTSVITTAGTANFDGMVPASWFRRVPVPQATIGVNSVVGLNKQAGLYPAVAVKSMGIASVATLQF